MSEPGCTPADMRALEAELLGVVREELNKTAMGWEQVKLEKLNAFSPLFFCFPSIC